MQVEEEHICKYCKQNLEDCLQEGLRCIKCFQYVHLKCLIRGTVPGGMNGDVFFTFTCIDCSEDHTEHFVRDKLSWLQVIVLVLYHLNTKSPGLARKGFYHWRFHIATFIDKNWENLFSYHVKKKKSWTGTVAGMLSNFSVYFFLSGTSVFKEQAWWTLKYPKLSPYLITKIYNALNLEKHKTKSDKVAVFNDVLKKYVKNSDLLIPFKLAEIEEPEKTPDEKNTTLPLPTAVQIQKGLKEKEKQKRSSLFSDSDNKKKMKHNSLIENYSNKMTANLLKQSENQKTQLNSIVKHGGSQIQEDNVKPAKLLDPLCHYNTSLSNISRLKGVTTRIKLMGNLRKDLIFSPYSGIYLKPYIRRDATLFPDWLKLMAEIQLTVNLKHNPNYVLPPRGPLDYTYVQPEHIPAINSLCNQFFWPGIDLTECLQYPDFSCVVLYKNLIVGFAFLVPNVSHTENYLSFLFTRPCWRNIGMAKFMLYHIIQTSLGKDITLHVSLNNPALFLYQKFGFKVEHVALDFYDKYIRDRQESKHAFFCRLGR